MANVDELISLGVPSSVAALIADRYVSMNEASTITADLTLTGTNAFNGTVGATTPAAGDFTALTSTSGALNGTLGATTADTIVGTTITADTEFRGTVLTSNAASAVAVKTSGGTQFNIAHTASAVNYWQFTGAAASGQVYLQLAGSDDNVSALFSSKGSGNFSFRTDSLGAEQLRIEHTASAVEYLQATGAASGGTPTLSAQGAASDLDLGVTPKGTGIVTSAAAARILSGTAIPAGGTAGAGYRFSSTANFGTFFGSGAPSLAAAKGSLYLRSDGSTTNDRAYINTDGNTTWTALTTAA